MMKKFILFLGAAAAVTPAWANFAVLKDQIFSRQPDKPGHYQLPLQIDLDRPYKKARTLEIEIHSDCAATEELRLNQSTEDARLERNSDGSFEVPTGSGPVEKLFVYLKSETGCQNELLTVWYQ